MQLEKGTVDALFVLKRMKEEHREKDKSLYKHFPDLEKAFERVPRKVARVGNEKKRDTRDDGENGNN